MAEKSVSSQSSMEDDDYDDDDDHSESSDSSSSSSEDDAEEKEDADAYEIRMKAYNLINKVGDVPPSKAKKAEAEAKKKKDNMTVLEESISTIQNVITGADLINDVEEADRTEKVDKSQWPSKPDRKSFQSYQQQQQQSKPSSSTNSSQQKRRQDDGGGNDIDEQEPRMMRIGGSEYYHENDDDDDHVTSAGMVGTLALGVVTCVSEACKLGASNMINFQTINSGYQTIKSAVIPEMEDRIFGNTSSHGQPSGTFQTVDYTTTSYGGGGSRKGNGYVNRGRYSDIP